MLLRSDASAGFGASFDFDSMTASLYPTDGEAAHSAWIEIPLVVDTGAHGYRLDRFLALRIQRLSRTRVQTIIDLGRVRCRERPQVELRAATRVVAGQTMIITRPAPVEPPSPHTANVLVHDSDLLVLDKPAGLAVHPSARYHRHTLTAVLRDVFGAGHGWEMAHRLDRETSGVIAFGRHGGTATALKRAFARRQVTKHYLAIVRGVVRSTECIDVPLGAAIGSRVRIKIGPRALSDGGLPARTDIEPIAVGEFAGEPVTLVRARPYTGRQHQIRVHLDVLGHPVLGDKLYGIDEQAFVDVHDHGRLMSELEADLGIARQALHAHELELRHPADGRPLRITAPWPPELAAIVGLPVEAARPDPPTPRA